jgi:hypothetical protein
MNGEDKTDQSQRRYDDMKRKHIENRRKTRGFCLALGTVALVLLLLLPKPLPSQAAYMDMIINEILADPPSGIAGDANGDGVRDSQHDEFVELVNTTASPLDISGWWLSDSGSSSGPIRHVFPSDTIVDPLCPVVVFGGGFPADSFPENAIIQTASTGNLSLNNGGDTVTLFEPDGANGAVVHSYNDASWAAIADQSMTRNPDITGQEPLVGHTEPSNSVGLFSPGRMVDGTPFPGAVPIPSAVWLFGSGLIGLAGLRRKLRS